MRKLANEILRGGLTSRVHTLVVPKKHTTDVFEIEDGERDTVMRAVKKISLALEKSLKPTGINLGMNNRSGAGEAANVTEKIRREI